MLTFADDSFNLASMTTIHFYLRFRSTYGQTFFVSGNIPELGNGDPQQAMPIHYLNDDLWHHSIDVADDTPAFTYKYMLRNSDGYESIEWPTDRSIDVAKLKSPEIQVIDQWNYAGEFENAFYTQPFTQTLFEYAGEKVKAGSSKGVNHIFKVKAPLLGSNETLCLLGSDAALGSWNEADCIVMRKEGNWYTAGLNLSKAQFPIAYKYGVYNTASKQLVRYEDGSNRMLYGMVKKQLVILHDGFAALPNNTFKGAGVAIPVFSLRSENGLGVGEFTDIPQLADWCKQVGMKLVQLLPLNDTSATGTWTDSYPYAAISAFALHPQYINLEKVAGKKHAALLKGLDEAKARLNALEDVDYEALMQLKWQYLKALYEAQKDSWQKDAAYQEYFEQNKHWLEPYAAFCYLRDKYNTTEFHTWKTHSSYDAKNVAKLLSPKAKSYDAVAIHLFVQWHLHLQLKAAVDYAHTQGLVVKGDIPIGIYRHSCDAWTQPELYNMDAQAGAPPDDFAVKGQNWGFPTYNWQRMQADGFAWWKQRFEQMSLYFDAFRIDHILGFFRIWSIPMDAVEGILGRFVPCLPVHIDEFAQKGIWFDYNRYCQPFINEQLVNEWFGEKADWVKATFLEDMGWGSLRMKDAFATQRKVEAWFTEHFEVEEWIKLKLYDCISNVILIEEPGSNGTQYHFRIGMEGTSSYQWLNEHVRRQLSELYVNYFFRRQNDFWRQQAMQKLPALKASTNMLICGEDLGMVPDCVPGVMKDLGFLSLEIQRMPKDPTKEFFHPGDAPYLSVVTPSTHDMSTIRGWWEESRDTTQRFYNEQLGQWGEAPFYCEPWINRAIITQHVYSPAMWSIFQLQDLLGSSAELRRTDPNAERINVPANPKHYWRYRMHLTLSELQSADTFNTDIHGLLQSSGRCDR
ncbi:4-alpha-glucanotransferase [Phnomibacter sp.]|uniref:4-alpha-glucanotransferase n=1 Tax=Phnomibacter sp. TaxID=2836217 RepID=UPI002FDE3251